MLADTFHKRFLRVAGNELRQVATKCNIRIKFPKNSELNFKMLGCVLISPIAFHPHYLSLPKFALFDLAPTNLLLHQQPSETAYTNVILCN